MIDGVSGHICYYETTQAHIPMPDGSHTHYVIKTSINDSQIHII